MKKLVFLFLISLLIGCQDNFDYGKAREVANKGMELMKAGNYTDLAKLYSVDFSNSETPERRQEKFKKIFDATGDVKAYKLLDSTDTPLNENYEATIRYKLSCTHVNVTAYFTLMKEKGEYCISKIRVEQE